MDSTSGWAWKSKGRGGCKGGVELTYHIHIGPEEVIDDQSLTLPFGIITSVWEFLALLHMANP